MDKSGTEYKDQSDWSDYEESEEVSVPLSDTHNESNNSEILPRKRKQAFHAYFIIIRSYRKGLSAKIVHT